MRKRALYFVSLSLLILACGNTNRNSSSSSNESIVEEAEEWED